MPEYRIYKNLSLLNELSPDAARELFEDCGGSPEWVRLMVEARPFAMLENLFESAHAAWLSTGSDDRTFEIVRVRLGRLLER